MTGIGASTQHGGSAALRLVAGTGVDSNTGIHCHDARQTLTDAMATLSHPRDFRRLYLQPQRGNWRTFAEVTADNSLLDAWFDSALQRYGGRCEVAGSMTSLRLAGSVLDMAVSLWVHRGWAVPLPADGLLLQFDDHHLVTGVALRDPVVITATATPPDHAATSRDSPATHAVHDYLAMQVNALLQPAFIALKSRTRYGLRGMWGQVADQIASIAARRCRLLGMDQVAGWQRATQLIDALARVQPLVRMRPVPFMAHGPVGPATVAVKGTCCLYFRACDPQDAERHCSTCPLLTDDGRAPRVSAYLHREHEHLHAG